MDSDFAIFLRHGFVSVAGAGFVWWIGCPVLLVVFGSCRSSGLFWSSGRIPGGQVGLLVAPGSFGRRRVDFAAIGPWGMVCGSGVESSCDRPCRTAYLAHHDGISPCFASRLRVVFLNSRVCRGSFRRSRWVRFANRYSGGFASKAGCGSSRGPQNSHVQPVLFKGRAGFVSSDGARRR